MTNHTVLYQHSKRPEWGYCAVADTQEDRTTFKFDDGLDRTIRHDHLQMMQQVFLEEPQASEVQERIAKYLTPRSVRVGKPKAKKPAAKKVAKTAPKAEAKTEAAG